MALTVTAQGVDGIKRNSSYLYGEGGGVTLQAAKEAALADLIQKISVTVHSDFTSKERELIRTETLHPTLNTSLLSAVTQLLR